MANTLKSRSKVSSKNYVLPPIEDYYIKDEALIKTDKPIIDYSALLFDCKRVLMRGNKKEKSRAKQMISEYINGSDFINLDFLSDTDNTHKLSDFLSKFPDEYKDKLFGEVYLSPEKIGEDEYNKAIQKWEADIRKLQATQLSESDIWSDDRGNGIDKQIMTYPLLYPSLKLPTWLMASNTFNEPNFHMDDIEKVCLAHAIKYTLPPYMQGYYENEGHVERWCRCDSKDVHKAFISLYEKNLVHDLRGTPTNEDTRIRRWMWVANVPYISMILANYGRSIDK